MRAYVHVREPRPTAEPAALRYALGRLPFPIARSIRTTEPSSTTLTAWRTAPTDVPSTVRSAGASLGPMTETPDEDTARRDEDEGAARDSLAGDIAREIDPDVDDLADGGNGGTPDT